MTRHASVDKSVRPLTSADIPAVLVLSSAAGWNQTADDWKLLLQPGIGECLAIERDGRVVATTTLVCYAQELAWVGMVLTHPDFRNQGLARRLVGASLMIAAEKTIRTVKLDATELGIQLYRSLGFREEQTIERWLGTGRLPSKSDQMPPLGMPDLELDREAFGADRTRILEFLAKRAAPLAAEDGFAMFRSGARASYIGPCVARSPESAKRLIGSCLRANLREWYWDLLPSNRAAVDIAKGFNFKRERVLVRMVKGPDLKGNESLIYAGGGFEIG